MLDFTQAQLEAAWSKVADPKDWKAPVKAIVVAEDLVVTLYAISHFTATEASVRPADGDHLREDGKIVGASIASFHVAAPGYRAGPAGP